MHRDYRRSSSVQVVRFTDRIEITNPGHSLKAPEKFDTHGSALRNPNIAYILYEMHLAETMGSGIGRIKEAMADSKCPAPTFENSTRADEFSVVLPFDSAVGPSAPEAETNAGKQSDSSEAKSGGSEAKPGGSEAKSGGLKSSLLDELPETQALALEKLGGRIPQEIMRNLIRNLCTLRLYRPVELATLLERSRDYITQNYLSPMVEEGELARIYPDTPGHPKQAYRTIAPDSEGNDG